MSPTLSGSVKGQIYLLLKDSSGSPNDAQRVRVIQMNKPTRCNNFSGLLLVVQIQLNMFRASSCPSSGAKQLQ
jgi:hypothetical protein